MPIVTMPKIGKPPTSSLFYELSYTDTKNCVFTTKEEDHNGYLSFIRLYLEYTDEDPTEYTFAEEVFGSWRYWEHFINTEALTEVIAKARSLAERRQKSRIARQIVKKIKNGTASFSEQKIMFENGFSPVAPVKAKKTKKEKEVDDDLDDILERINA